MGAKYAEPLADARTPVVVAVEDPAKQDSTAADDTVSETAGDEGAGEADDPTDEAESDDAGEEETTDTDEKPSDFVAELAKTGVALTLDDIPAELRPLVEAKLKTIDAGFTKLRQRDRAQMKDAIALRAEARFQKERPADFILQLLNDRPELADQVNAKVEELEGSAIAREHHAIIVKDARAKAAEAEASASEEAERVEANWRTVRALAEKSARKQGIPVSLGVNDAIDAHVAKHGDITADDIEQIVSEKARAYRASVRARDREASKRTVQDKVTDRRTSGLKVRPGSGSAPAPGAAKQPKNDEEFLAYAAAKYAVPK